MGSSGDRTHSPDAVCLWAAPTSGKSLLTLDQSSTVEHARHAGCSSPWPAFHRVPNSKAFWIPKGIWTLGVISGLNSPFPGYYSAIQRQSGDPSPHPWRHRCPAAWDRGAVPSRRARGPAVPAVSHLADVTSSKAQGVRGMRREGSRDLAPMSASLPAG